MWLIIFLLFIYSSWAFFRIGKLQELCEIQSKELKVIINQLFDRVEELEKNNEH